MTEWWQVLVLVVALALVAWGTYEALVSIIADGVARGIREANKKK